MRAALWLVLIALPASAQQYGATFTAGGARLRSDGPLVGLGALELSGRAPLSPSLAVWGALRSAATFGFDGSMGLTDLGSELSVQWMPRDWSQHEGVFLRVLPFNAGRVRSSFDWLDHWGELSRPGQPESSVAGTIGGPSYVLSPMFQLALERVGTRAWIAGGVRSERLAVNGSASTFSLTPNVLAGASTLVGSHFRVEAAGAYFDRGSMGAGFGGANPTGRTSGGGASARATFVAGEPIGPQLDLLRYASDPERFERFFEPESYSEPQALMVMLEGGVATQTLRSSSAPSQLEQPFTGYADLQVRARQRNVRLFATGRVRPADFVLFDGPGLLGAGTACCFAPRNDAARSPELSLFLGGDLRIPSLDLTPGILVRVVRRAGLRETAGGSPLLPQGVFFAFESYDRYTVTPDGSTAPVVFNVKASLKYQPLAALTLVAEYEMSHTVGTEPVGSTAILLAQARF